MPTNEFKVIKIILAEVGTIEERCEGYRDSLTEALTDIITDERRHHVTGTNIQQRVAAKCSAVGQFLAEKRTDS